MSGLLFDDDNALVYEGLEVIQRAGRVDVSDRSSLSLAIRFIDNGEYGWHNLTRLGLVVKRGVEIGREFVISVRDRLAL